MDTMAGVAAAILDCEGPWVKHKEETLIPYAEDQQTSPALTTARFIGHKRETD